jgi:DNA-binding NtrC family response regulator
MNKLHDILLLDDDRMVHLLVDRLSRQAALPWRIRHVYFLEEALRLIQDQSFDLMLSDIHLQPPHNVWQLLRRIPAENKLNVVIVSSSVDAEARTQAIQFERIKAIIEKPLPMPQIQFIHRQLLQANKA